MYLLFIFVLYLSYGVLCDLCVDRFGITAQVGCGNLSPVHPFNAIIHSMLFFSNPGFQAKFGLEGTILKKGPTSSPQNRILRDSLIVYDFYLFIYSWSQTIVITEKKKKKRLGTRKLEQFCTWRVVIGTNVIIDHVGTYFYQLQLITWRVVV